MAPLKTLLLALFERRHPSGRSTISSACVSMGKRMFLEDLRRHRVGCTLVVYEAPHAVYRFYAAVGADSGVSWTGEPWWPWNEVRAYCAANGIETAPADNPPDTPSLLR